MNLYIDIIDTLDDSHVTSIENASKNSVKLKYNGSDVLDELLLVGSSLSITILLPPDENEDAALIELFTSDEKRYKVEIRTEETDQLIWQGYLLPDSYNEPYKNGNLPIDLEATDGLGRLKGKYLSKAYYSEEKSVIDIVSQCLLLTNLEMPIVFAPGIDNRYQKNWHQIYIDTSNFIDKDKRDDAATILEDILTSLVSCVYQHLGRWFVEGYNKRSKQTYDAKLYTSAGVFQNNETINKVVRDVDDRLLATPNITIIPPYGQITVNTEQNVLSLDETVYKERNDGWSPAIGVVEEIYATEWYHAGFYNFFAKAAAPDYKVYLSSTEDSTNHSLKLVQLLRRPYIKKNAKIKLQMTFEIDYYGTESSQAIESLIANGSWTNPFDYYVYLGTTLLLTNTAEASTYTRSLQFNSDKNATLTFDFIAQEARLLNILFRQPLQDVSATKIKGIYLDEITLEQVGETDSLSYTETLIEDYTVTKDIDLEITDDATGLSKAFRLFKLNAPGVVYNTIDIPVLSGFTQNYNYYTVVSLEGANLIADNIDEVYYNGNPIIVADVIYNYNDGEQMVLRVGTSITSGTFQVRQYRILNQDLDRYNWEVWTDSIYNLESKRLADAVLGVYSRLFKKSYPMIEGDVKNVPVLFNDLVRFNYIEDTLFVPTHLDANLDNGQTRTRLSKSNYLEENELVPPFVDVGSDLFLTSGNQSVNIAATAFDPDGTIVTYLWEQISGDTTATITSPNTPTTDILFMSGNSYAFRLTVTDNDGLTSSDDVTITRVVDYTASLELVENFRDDDTVVVPSYSRTIEAYKVYKINVDPALQANQTIVFFSDFQLFVYDNYTNSVGAIAELTVYKNNNLLAHFSIPESETSNDSFQINYINGDDIRVKLRVWVYSPLTIGPQSLARSTYKLNFGTVQNNEGIVLGLPIEVEIEEET